MAALFVALGGTSYAAFTLPANSVGTKQLQKGAVTTKKIKNGAVTASKINTTGLTVPNALQANNANNAANASHANTANSSNTATDATNATNAGNSNTVDGETVTKVDLAPTTNSNATIFSGDGITLTAVCDGSTHVGINAQSSDSNAELNWTGEVSGFKDGTGTGVFTVMSAGLNEGSIDIQFATTNGHSVTADLGTDYSNAFNTPSFTHCGVWGTVVAG